jgi:hypothetical protein
MSIIISGAMFGDGGFATGWNRKGGVQEGGTVMHSSSLFYDSAVPTLDEKTMPFSPLHSPR